MGKRILGLSLSTSNTSATPTGAAGIDMTQFTGAAKSQWWLVTVDVLYLADDVFIWGALPQGTPDDPSDDIWGLHQDEFATFPLGFIGNLDPGRHHFMVDGLGLYTRVALQTGGASTEKAFLDLSTLGDGLLDTVVEAQVAGAAGEDITVALVADGLGVGTIDDDPNAIVIHYEPGVTTVANVEALIATSTQIEVKTSGTILNVLDAGSEFSATNLQGGATHLNFTLSEIYDAGRGN